MTPSEHDERVRMANALDVAINILEFFIAQQEAAAKPWPPRAVKPERRAADDLGRYWQDEAVARREAIEQARAARRTAA